MKTATAFLVAVTVFASVFLETSTAPNPLFGTIAFNLGGTAEGLGKIASNTITKVGGVLDEVVKKALKDIETLIQGAGKILSGLKATIGEVNQVATVLGGELGEKLTEVLNKLQNTVKQLFELAEKIVKALAEGADDNVKELVGLLKNVVANLKADVAGVIAVLDKISEKPGNDAAHVITTVKGILVKIDAFVEDILSKVAEATTAVVEGAKKLDDKAFVGYVAKEIKTCEDALAAVNKIVEEFLATATDEQKKNLAAVVEFLKEFGQLVNGMHEEVREAVKVIDRDILKKLIEKILAAIKNTKVQVTELLKTQIDEINEALVKFILEIIVPEAQKLVEVLNNQLD